MATAARKTAKSKVTATSFNPSDKAIKAADAGKKSLPVKKPAAKRATKGSPALAEALKTIAAQPAVKKPATPVGRVVAPKIVKPSKATVEAGKAPAAFEKAVKAGLKAARKPQDDKEAKALDKIVKNKKVAKAKAVTFRGFVIPVNRKSTDSEDSVPTISVKNVADTIKLFEKLPKGCTWLADTSAATKDTLNLYNKSGAYIAEVRINK